ncbi:MAG: 16S rRNA (uracil(1498)-N(3))-methyltransferase [Candidatus Marinimicrobia bacterium]|nr:16S rRNA (uracil(1498)-N(3))-methyltransferase [Candidatus Neomarinimicrobiota bacterium]MBT3574588.1 16S rRNA (uracil(1498)-N(3))-methyltransferase [Candidatus Neomarinimicrobiota bacterium]MBT4481459.1 16S rRNA (uracil(1498)-N(3))-methyltransferase [Candidatus Neomarinimicrobiota bacterium]MBT5787010.1 16S rRNA (uracil(1498)-N(3))-methyltransferase [Candidatus Neomarinimicrobiota bacterium]MBT6304548.1 16S rRNA (uracil(1498)-N(3))-methyltransferase [Candidatus Neomarinimicrobiota bacterium
MITGEQVFLPAFQSGQTHLKIEGTEFHHLVRVRRFTEGDEIWVVNGTGTAARATLDSIGESSLDLVVLEEFKNRGELGINLILAVANLKGDHLNLIVEKATELGVNEIIPLLTDHTIKKGINTKRLERIAVSAMKQSRRSRFPRIHDITPFQTAVKNLTEAVHLFCYGSDSSASIVPSIQKMKGSIPIVIWIGPEGDWSKDEIDLASISDYTFTGLGPRRLRAETAAIHAVGLVSALQQDSV